MQMYIFTYLCRTRSKGCFTSWNMEIKIYECVFGHGWSSASEKWFTVKCKKNKPKIRLLLLLCIQIRWDFEGTESGNTHRVSLLDAGAKIQRHHFWKYFPDPFLDLSCKCCSSAAAWRSREESTEPLAISQTTLDVSLIWKVVSLLPYQIWSRLAKHFKTLQAAA